MIADFSPFFKVGADMAHAFGRALSCQGEPETAPTPPLGDSPVATRAEVETWLSGLVRAGLIRSATIVSYDETTGDLDFDYEPGDAGRAFLTCRKLVT